MAIIETKYNLGQTVYHSYCVNEAYYEACPDCDGTGLWKIEGRDCTIECQTCNKHNYRWCNTPGKIKKYKYFPSTEKLTIGQIRATAGYKPEIQYMCKETGLGSGSLWNENTLTDDYDLAVRCSEILSEKKNAGENVEVSELYLQEGGVND